MNPIISIIIPHHNIPNLLERCLASIPETNEIEIIVIDDNSSSDIVDFEKFPGQAKSNVTTIFSKEGKGAGYARNLGLKYAKGKWLLFADSDDFFTENAFDTIFSLIDSNAEMILFKALSVESETLKKSNRNERINQSIDLCLKGEMSAKEASLLVQVPWCRMIRRSFVEKHSIIFDEVMASNDTMFTTKVACLADKIDVLDEAIYVVTYRKNSLWDQRRTNPKNYLVRLEVQIRRNQYISQFGYKKTPILGWVVRSFELGFPVFWKSFAIALKNNALFDGVSQYLRRK